MCGYKGEALGTFRKTCDPGAKGEFPKALSGHTSTSKGGWGKAILNFFVFNMASFFSHKLIS